MFAHAGAKLSNVEDIQHNIGKLNSLPLLSPSGLACRHPKMPRKVSKVADGVIVGSAIVKRIVSHQQDPAMIGHVAEFVRSLKAAMAVG